MAGTLRVSGPWKSPLFNGLSGDPEEQLLAATALASVSGLAGQLPGDAKALPADAGPETAPMAPDGTLALLLSGEHRELLPEWLELCRGRRVPHFYLPALLGFGARDRSLRQAIAAVGGARAQWLARRNKEWKYLLSQEEETDIWETASGTVRVEWFAGLRQREPHRARELLQATWVSESADERARMVESFQHGLSENDREFLETAARDRSKSVRRAAVRLLIFLPGTELQREWIGRARSWVNLRRESRWMGLSQSTKLEVTLPAEAPDDPEQLLRAEGTIMGEKAWWLAHAVSFVPLSVWEGPPEVWIDAARASDWQLPMQHGWEEAAARQKNVAWARALLQRGSSGDELFRLLAHAEREEMILKRVGELPPRWLAGHNPYSEEAAAHLFQWLAGRLKAGDVADSPNLARVLPDLALVLPPRVPVVEWPEQDSHWRYWEPRVEMMMARLQFRQAMHEEMK